MEWNGKKLQGMVSEGEEWKYMERKGKRRHDMIRHGK
jgi:hypothetical protein